MIAICRGTDVRLPCPYSSDCPPARQGVMHGLDLRGSRCVHFQIQELEHTYPGQPMPADQEREFSYAKAIRGNA